MHRARYLWITCAPMAWLVVAVFSAAIEKIFSEHPRIGFLAQANQLADMLAKGGLTAEKTAELETLIFNARLDAAVCGIFLVLVSTILIDSIRLWIGVLRGTRDAKVLESPFVLSRLRAEEI
jgi:carbon starvation protein